MTLNELSRRWTSLTNVLKRYGTHGTFKNLRGRSPLTKRLKWWWCSWPHHRLRWRSPSGIKLLLGCSPLILIRWVRCRGCKV